MAMQNTMLFALLVLSVRSFNISDDLEYRAPARKDVSSSDISKLLDLQDNSIDIEQLQNLSLYDMSLRSPDFNHGSQTKGTCSAKLKQANERIANFEVQVSDWQTKAEFFENQFKNLKTENNQLRAKIAQLVEKLNQEENCDAFRSKVDDLQVQNQRLVADNKKLFDDNKALNDSANKLRNDLKNSNEENKVLSVKNDQLRLDYSALNDKYKKLQADYDNLSKDSTEITRLKKELDSATRQNNEQTLQTVELSLKIKELSRLINKLADENVRLFNDNKLLSAQNKRFFAEIKQIIENSRAEVAELKKMIVSLNARLEIAESSQQNNDKFKDQIKEFKNIIGLLEKRVQVLETEKSISAEKIDRLLNEIDSLNQELLKKTIELNSSYRQNSPNCQNSSTSASTSANAVTFTQLGNDMSLLGPSIPSLPSFDNLNLGLLPQPIDYGKVPKLLTGNASSSEFE